MILTETITNGALSADYTIVISFSIIGALLLALSGIVSHWLVSTLKDIRDSIKELHQRVSKLEDSDIATQIKLNDAINSVNEYDKHWEDQKKESQMLQREILNKIQQIKTSS